MMLEIRDMHAYYGQSHILHGVNLDVNEGEIVSLLGRNGVGRSTTCKAIMGLVTPQGSVKYRGKELAGLRSDLVAQAGIGYVPEDRQIFPTLTVRQNLELGLKKAGKFGRWNFDDVFRLFPNLANRQHNAAGVLSGGEQQMLTMCRTLMGDPAEPVTIEMIRDSLDTIRDLNTAVPYFGMFGTVEKKLREMGRIK